jgi:excisionase family DNA binding protein
MSKRTPAVPAPPTAPLTVAEACELSRACRRTIGRWIREDRFQSWRPIASGSGRRLIDRTSFLEFLGRGAEVVS